MEFRQKGALISMMSEGDITACAGLRGIQQVRRSSRSTSRSKTSRVRSNVRQAKEQASKPGFQAELLAAKLLGRPPGVIEQAKPPPLVVVRKQAVPLPSPFRQYYKQHFQGNAICKRSMDALYNSMAPARCERAEIGIKAELPHTNECSNFRFKPSVGTWNLTLHQMRPLENAVVTQSETLPEPMSVPMVQSASKPSPEVCVFANMPSVGSWLLPVKRIMVSSINESGAPKTYAPRLQARSHEYLENLENALSRTSSNIKQVPHKAYAPRLQACSHQHLTSLEIAYSHATKDEERPTSNARAPRIQARSNQYLTSLENALSRGDDKHPTSQAYAPRVQAHRHHYFQALENILKGTASNDTQAVQHRYKPSLQARRHEYLAYLEQALSGSASMEGTEGLGEPCSLTMPDSPVAEMSTDTVLPADRVEQDLQVTGMVCMQSPILFGPSFWSMGLRPMPFFL